VYEERRLCEGQHVRERGLYECIHAQAVTQRNGCTTTLALT
jgi:hypothetical protein